MAVIEKDLGPVSAYAVAVAHGYTGTEAEWEALIANSAINAQSADASATAAAASAQEATQQKTQAQAQAAAAQAHALDASRYAQNAGQANSYAQMASSNAAVSAANASNAQTAAEAAQAAAEAAVTGAEAAQAAAEAAVTDAQTAKTAAETAAATAAAAYGTDLLADDYSTSKTYAVGDYVIYSGNLYRCTTAITTAEAWTAAHWTRAQVGPDLDDLKSAFTYESIIGINRVINSTFTHTGDIGATRNFYADVYLENDIEYRLQLWYSANNNFTSLSSSGIYVEDENGNRVQTILNYTAMSNSGTTFTFSGETGKYRLHITAASAASLPTNVFENGTFIYNNTLYPAQFQSGTVTINASANSALVSQNSYKLNNKTDTEIENSLKSYTDNAIAELVGEKIYVAIGDSITAGSNASAYSKNYYWLLRSQLVTDGAIDKSVNIGVAGANTKKIELNCGAIGLYLTSDVTIPATNTGVTLSLNLPIINSGNTIIEANRVNDCYISGIPGKLTYSSGNYTFTRNESGTAKFVGAGSPVILYGGIKTEEAEIMTIFAGTNDNLDTNQSDEKNAAVVERIKTIARMSKNGKYLVIGPYVNSVNSSFRELLSETFGQRYIDLYAYMSNQSIHDAIDEELIESGEQADWASILLSDGLHPNDNGHKLIFERIYEQMKELGWT